MELNNWSATERQTGPLELERLTDVNQVLAGMETLTGGTHTHTHPHTGVTVGVSCIVSERENLGGEGRRALRDELLKMLDLHHWLLEHVPLMRLWENALSWGPERIRNVQFLLYARARLSPPHPTPPKIRAN